MASISHLAAGAVCGAIYARQTHAKALPTIIRFAVLGAAADLDFIALEMGLSHTPLGHRVMTHSLPFALVAGTALGMFFGPPGATKLAAALAVMALASHGLLDAMTANGPGPQLLWPFSSAEIQFAWHPIPGTQFYQEYFTAAAIPVLSVEAVLSLPLVVAAGWILLRRAGARPGPNE